MYSAYFISFLFTVLLTPLINRLSSYFGLLDKPDARRRHSKPTARLGGVAIFISCLLTFLLLKIFIFNFVEITNLVNKKSNISIFFFGLITYFLIGLTDDIYRLSPWPRLVAQAIIAAIIWFFGFRIESYDLFISGNLNYFTSFFFTIFWIMGVTNAINWLDGLDGLASGVSSISFVGIGIIALNNNHILIAILSAILAGSCVGFLSLNSHPAKIFMGDSGSFLIGFSLASLSIMACTDSENNIDFIPILIMLLLPILDMIQVIFGRIIKSKSPFFPDRSHLHYKLIDLGFSQKNVFILYFSISTIILLAYANAMRINFPFDLLIINILLNLFFLLKHNLRISVKKLI